MSDSGFGPGDIVNRRVNDHLQQLLPSQVSPTEDYHLEGQRGLPPSAVPGNGDECLCLLESYVGEDGQFSIRVERVFDRQTDREWRIENTISRTGARSLSPFTYVVRSRVEILGDIESDRSRVTWTELADDQIYGGREAQAAVFLTEKMSQLRARENGQGRNHAGSLSGLGSLASVIDTGRQLQTDWEELDELLGPTADTIAATAGFEALEKERRVEAERKGIDFLADDLTDGADRSRVDKQAEHAGRDSPSWKTPPAELTVEETTRKLRELNANIRQMRRDFESRD
jgi:hypothetical protein